MTLPPGPHCVHCGCQPSPGPVRGSFVPALSTVSLKYPFFRGHGGEGLSRGVVGRYAPFGHFWRQSSCLGAQSLQCRQDPTLFGAVGPLGNLVEPLPSSLHVCLSSAPGSGRCSCGRCSGPSGRCDSPVPRARLTARGLLWVPVLVLGERVLSPRGHAEPHSDSVGQQADRRSLRRREKRPALQLRNFCFLSVGGMSAFREIQGTGVRRRQRPRAGSLTAVASAWRPAQVSADTGGSTATA